MTHKSPGVLSDCALWHCGAQWLLDIYTVPAASVRLGTRRAPSIRWEAQASPLSTESHSAIAAAISESHARAIRQCL